MKFSEIQRKMQIAKSQKQGFGAPKYAFRNAEEIETKFKEVSKGSDWLLTFPEDEITEGYYKAKAVCQNEETGIKFEAIGWAELSAVPILKTQKGEIKQMSEPQWTGAVSSYARKYALQGLFAIGEEDVDDLGGAIDNEVKPATTKAKPKAQPKQQAKPAQATNEQVAEVSTKLVELGTTSKTDIKKLIGFVSSKVGFDKLENMTVADYQNSMTVIDGLFKKLEEGEKHD